VSRVKKPLAITWAEPAPQDPSIETHTRKRRDTQNISSRRTQWEIKNPPPNINRGLPRPDLVEQIPFLESSFETIDGAVMDYVNKTLNIFTDTNDGFSKVPVLWVGSERAYQLKAHKDLRDSEETFILPLITVYRSGISKTPENRAIPAANIPEVRDAMGGAITIGRTVYQKKTAEFQNADAKRKYGQSTWPVIQKPKMVYETISIPFPTWIGVNYEIALRSEYQQQMNQMMRKFIRQGGLNSMPYRIERAGHKFEVFIDGDLANNSNVSNMDMDQRNYETIVNLKVLGYLIGDGENQEKPNIVRRQNAVEVKIPRERVILGDIQDFLNNSGFYKE